MRANKITDKLSILTKAGRKLKYREEEIKYTFGDLDWKYVKALPGESDRNLLKPWL